MLLEENQIKMLYKQYKKMEYVRITFISTSGLG